MSPFDKARFERLLEGLEVCVVNLSELENEMTIGSEYYSPSYSVPVDILRNSGHPLETIESICSLVTDGDHGSADYVESGIPFVLSEAVEEGWIDINKCRYISAAHAKTLSRSEFRAGDILVSKTGVYFGKSAVVDESFKGANTIAHVGLLRLMAEAGIDAHYFSTFLNSRFGQAQLRRRGIKATRPEIKLLEFKDIIVPRLSDALQSQIKAMVLSAQGQRKAAGRALDKAGDLLMRAIGLYAWEPPEALSYVCSSGEVFAAGRLDAQFFAPRVEQLLALLGRDGLRLSDVAPARHERFEASESGEFDYIEIGSLGSDGTASVEAVPMAEAASRASQHVRSGDVITSTVRPIRRLSAIIAPQQDGAVCSSGFVVLQPQDIRGEVLLTYLRLPLICELMDLHTSATMYPAISEADLLALPVPAIPPSLQGKVQEAVRESHQSRQLAARLLDAARHMVEVAVEDSEAAAISFMDGVCSTSNLMPNNV